MPYSKRYSKYNQPLHLGGQDEEGVHRPFVSLFCGGCAVEAKVKADVKICNDLHPYLIAMWQGLQNGWIPPDAVSKEEYQYIKAHKDENPALTGFVGFGCSFGGRWFGGYAPDVKKSCHYPCAASKRAVLRDMRELRNAIFMCKDYREVDMPDNAVVYCDPPYAGTAGYSTGAFDHSAFWDYMRQLAKRGCKVFISEERAPDDFTCVWQKEKRRTLNKDDNTSMVRIERLWTI